MARVISKFLAGNVEEKTFFSKLLYMYFENKLISFKERERERERKRKRESACGAPYAFYLVSCNTAFLGFSEKIPETQNKDSKE